MEQEVTLTEPNKKQSLLKWKDSKRERKKQEQKLWHYRTSSGKPAPSSASEKQSLASKWNTNLTT